MIKSIKTPRNYVAKQRLNMRKLKTEHEKRVKLYPIEYENEWFTFSVLLVNLTENKPCVFTYRKNEIMCVAYKYDF